MNKIGGMISRKALEVYARQCSIELEALMNIASQPINSVEEISVVFLLVLEHLVFVSIGWPKGRESV